LFFTRFLKNITERGVLSRRTKFARRSASCRRRTSGIAGQIVHRQGLAEEPRQSGKRVVRLIAGWRWRTASRSRIAVRTMIVFSHKVRPVSGVPCRKAPEALDPYLRLTSFKRQRQRAEPKS
jgi:hypothetical protein